MTDSGATRSHGRDADHGRAAARSGAEERRRTTYEGLTGERKSVGEAGYDVRGLMGSHRKDASVHLRYGWHVLRAFNGSGLRRPGEQPFTIERW